MIKCLHVVLFAPFFVYNFSFINCWHYYRVFLSIIHIIAGLTAIEAWMLSCILFVFGCLIGNMNFLALTIFCCHSIFTLETYNRILSLCIIIVFINNQSRIWRFSPTYWFIILRICNNSSSEAVGISPTSSQSRKGKDIIMAWHGLQACSHYKI